jgi:hypothetical protein
MELYKTAWCILFLPHQASRLRHLEIQTYLPWLPYLTLPYLLKINRSRQGIVVKKNLIFVPVFVSFIEVHVMVVITILVLVEMGDRNLKPNKLRHRLQRRISL